MKPRTTTIPAKAAPAPEAHDEGLGDRVETLKHDVADKVAEIRADVVEKAGALRDEVVERAGALKHDVVEELEASKADAMELRDAALDGGRAALEQSRTFIGKHPFVSVGLFAVLGLGFGMLLRRL